MMQLVLFGDSDVTNSPIAQFPIQFSANIVITSPLIDESSEYPPRQRRFSVYYDYIQKKARADIEAGYEAAKYYIRRYDNKKEFMVRLPPINDCKRSYLGETMPFPELPFDTLFVREEYVNNELCNYYLYEESTVRIHIYFTVTDNIPVKLIVEQYDSDELSKELLVYEYFDVYLGPPLESWFDLPEEYNSTSSVDRNGNTKNCAKHTGGFPYLHIFHHFVKF